MQNTMTLKAGRSRTFATAALVSAAMLTVTPAVVGQMSNDNAQNQQQTQQTDWRSNADRNTGQQSSQMGQQDKLLLRVNKLMDKPVYSQNGDQKLGTLSNVVFDTQSGDIVYAVLTGQSDGNMYAVPWNAINIEDQSGSSASMSSNWDRGANRAGGNADTQADRQSADRDADADTGNDPLVGRREAYPAGSYNAETNPADGDAAQQSDSDQRTARNAQRDGQTGRIASRDNANRQADTNDRGVATEGRTAQQVADAQARGAIGDDANANADRSANNRGNRWSANADRGDRGDRFGQSQRGTMMYSEGDFRLTADITPQELKDAQGFSEGDWPEMANRQWAQATHEAYGQQPYWERDHNASATANRSDRANANRNAENDVASNNDNITDDESWASWFGDDDSESDDARANRDGSDKLWPLVKASDVLDMKVVQGQSSRFAMSDRGNSNRSTTDRDNATGMNRDAQAVANAQSDSNANSNSNGNGNARRNANANANANAQRNQTGSTNDLAQGDRVGTVKDVVIADKSGKVGYLIVDASNAIDGEDSLIAVPTDEVEFDGQDESISLNRSIRQYESQAFAQGDRPNFGNRGMAAGSFDQGTEWVVLGYEVVQIVPVRDSGANGMDRGDKQWSQQDRQSKTNRDNAMSNDSSDRSNSDRSNATGNDSSMDRNSDSAERATIGDRNTSFYGGRTAGEPAKDEIRGEVQSVERDGQNLTLVVETDDGQTRRLSLGDEKRLSDEGVRFEEGDQVVAHVRSGSDANADNSDAREVTRIRKDNADIDSEAFQQRHPAFDREEEAEHGGAQY